MKSQHIYQRVSLSLLFLICGCMKEAERPVAAGGSAAAPVSVADVEQRDVPVQIRAIAAVEAYSTVVVRSRVSGELQKVHITPGQDVKVNDLLFEIDPRPFDAALHEAQANLDRDSAMASNAQIDAGRVTGLLRENVATREEADKAKFTAQAAQATVRADQAAVETARLQLDYTKIRSPIDGRAGQVITHLGNIIKADDTQLLTINQVRPIYVTFSVPEQDLEHIRKYSQSAQPMVDVIIPPDEQTSVRGKLTFIDNQVDSATGTIRLKATFDNTENRLWPGQFVQAALNLAVESNRVVVPSRAIQTGQQGLFVFVVNTEMMAHMRPVTVHRQIGELTVIESGLEAGERVVTEGQLRLKPDAKGAKVAIKQAPSTAPTTNPRTAS